MASFLRVIVLSWVFTLAWFTLWMLMPYLTRVWNLKFTDAAAIVNVFVGVAAVGHLGMQFIVDAFLGHFWMLFFSTLAFSIGFGFLSLSASPVLSSSSDVCNATLEFGCIGVGQKLIFYAALAVISIGIYGHSISLAVFTEDQIEENASRDDARMLIRFFIGNVGNFIFPLVAAVAVPQISPWFLRFAVPAGCEVIAMVVFLSGSCSYRREKPEGSPLTTIFRVLVASAYKMSCKYPNNPTQLYEEQPECDPDLKPHARSLRCLDKAAIILPTEPLEQQRKNKWRLCRMTEVEETKSIIRTFPLFTTSIISGIIFSLGNTFFLEQASHMSTNIGTWNLPLPLLLLFNEAARLGSRELCLRAAKRHGTNSESPPLPPPSSPSPSRQNQTPHGIPVSIILSIFCCVIAAHVERKRLEVVKAQVLVVKPLDATPISVVWLLPQYILLGAITGIYENSFAFYLEERVPDQLSIYMVLSNVGICGIGTMSSVLLVDVVGKVSGDWGRKQSWFEDTIDKSRLDNYYWVLTLLNVLNLVFYISVTLRFTRCSKKGGAAEINTQENNQRVMDNDS